MMTTQERIKVSLKLTIQTLCELISLTPEQLEETILKDIYMRPVYLEDGRDLTCTIDNLQECLNNLLDARKRLMRIGFYDEKRETRKPQVQIRAGTKVPSSLEEEYRDFDSDSTHVSPDPTMEI